MAEKFNPLNVYGGASDDQMYDDENRPKKKEDLVDEIDYDRVREYIETMYIPKKVQQTMLDEYKTVVVRDYDDIYHKSEEEREASNQFYHLFTELLNMSHKENRIDLFIKRARLTLKALHEIAESNGVYSSEKFIKDYFSGKIEINGLPIPKLRKKFRDKYNIKYLMEFILSDQDPEEFDPPKSESDEDDNLEDLIPPENVNKVIHAKDSFAAENLFIEEGDETDEDNVAIITELHDAKKLGKKIPGLFESASSFKKAEKRMKAYQRSLDSFGGKSFIGDIRQSDYEAIKIYDQTLYDNPDNLREPKPPKDMSDDDAVEAYLAKMDEYLERTTYKQYGNQSLTIEEADELQVKDTLDANGFNLRSMYGYRKQRKQLKRIKKEEAKKEKELKERMTRLNDRRNQRLDAIDGGTRYADAKKRTLSEKDKKKRKKKAKKKSKKVVESSGWNVNKGNDEKYFDLSWDFNGGEM